MSSGETGSELLAYIVEHGEATVAELATALQVSDATVRRHMDKLVGAGLAHARSVRQATGRPYYAYQASEAGIRRERDHSADLVTRMVDEIKKGRADLTTVATGVAKQMADDHRSEVDRAGSLEERVRRTVAALHLEGILDGWEQTESGYRMRNCACPYRSAADATDSVCESDRLAIELLVGTNVLQVGSLVHGDRYCEYVVADREELPTPPSTGRGAPGSL